MEQYEDLARIDYYIELAKKKKLTKEELIFNIDKILDKYRADPGTQSEAFMSSPIGDLLISSDGLRKAVDEIARLNFYIHSLEERDKVMQDAVASLKENNAKLVKQNNKLEEEIIKLKEDRDKCIKTLEDNYTFKTTQNGLCDVFKIIRKAAIKEFAEKLKDKLGYCDEDYDICYSFFQEDLDKLLKEYGVK